jgi:hypothetical protein
MYIKPIANPHSYNNPVALQQPLRTIRRKETLLYLILNKGQLYSTTKSQTINSKTKNPNLTKIPKDKFPLVKGVAVAD